MALASVNLGTLSKLVTGSLIAGTALSILFGALVHPSVFAVLVLFGPLLLLDLYGRLVQKDQAILRNFGLFGAMRYVLESIGPEMRQYWIASDTEEKPFSRRERAEVYRYAKNVKIKSAAFGTQMKAVDEGTIRHSMFPLVADDLEPYALTFGEERDCPHPFTIQIPFMVSAMSFGSLGEYAVRAICRGARKGSIPVNTGEGGYPKHHLGEEADIIFQMGTAKFGVRNEDSSLNDDKLRELAGQEHVRMIEIKFSQGAKPGKGGLLPAKKVTREISELRGVPMGKDVYSPPRHVECDTPENTVAFIHRVQEVSGLPVGIKFCLGNGEQFRELLLAMKNAGKFPDYIAIDGAEGGTGAAPAAFLDHVGMPLFPALKEVDQILRDEGVRDRLKLVCAGKLINAARQIRAFAFGADAIYSARGFMLAIGCIQALQCNTDHCPVGITTHDPGLQRGLDIEEKSTRVYHYIRNMNHTLKELLAATGVRSFRELTRENLYLPERVDPL